MTPIRLSSETDNTSAPSEEGHHLHSRIFNCFTTLISFSNSVRIKRVNLLLVILITNVCFGRFAEAASSRGVCPNHDKEEDNTNKLDCVNFSRNISKNENQNEEFFFSPNYPHKYPNCIKCYKTITAPTGYVIRLEFRERFDVEPSSNCENDYLEVRDGLHGYAKLIGLFCGNTYPGEVTSSGRYLWLQFVSDDSLEYEGFKVVYKFIKTIAVAERPEMAPCYFPISGHDGLFGTRNILKETYNFSITHSAELTCIWEIQVQETWHIYVDFDEYALARTNECDKNFIDIFVGRLEVNTRKKRYCGSAAESLKIEKNVVFVLFYATDEALKSNFTIFFSAVRDIKNDEICSKSEFDCQDSTCIDSSLRCNHNKNCKYEVDEEGCYDTTTLFFASQEVLVILIVGLALLLSILIPSCVNCFRKWKHYGTEDDEQSVGGGGGGGGGGETRSQRESLGTRTAEGSLHESHILNSVMGSGGYCGQTNDGVNIEDDDNGCYVPEVDLSVFQKRSNGGHAILMDDSPFLRRGQETPLDSSSLPFDSTDPLIASAPPPPVLPPIHCSVHPNNLSLYHELPTRRRSVTPPLPPPPPPNFQDHNNIKENSVPYGNERNNSSFHTFLPPPPTEDELDEANDIFGISPPAVNTLKQPQHFKAKAVIEMQNNRPRSFESTKSAPDVVGCR